MKYIFTYRYAHGRSLQPVERNGPPYESLLIEADTVEDALSEAVARHDEIADRTGCGFFDSGEKPLTIMLMPRIDAYDLQEMVEFMMRNPATVHPYPTVGTEPGDAIEHEHKDS
jgi:hypothetical protein